MGISYAIVTKVKEYTETKQYGEALDLLEGEDIFQSLNPQFLRCCGKVYLETEHFSESRDALIKAHVMAPEAIRIIYDIVHLYLKMGYYTRAKRYFELYETLAGADDVGKLYLKYMLQKAQRVEAKELLPILEKACEEEYSDDWAFELSLLYASLGMQNKMKEECTRLMASFRSSPYYSLAEALKKGEYDISNSSFRFPLVEVDEDTEKYRSILSIEDEQWKQDDLKIHPPAAVILQMEDDNGEEEQTKKTPLKFLFGHKKSKDKTDSKKKDDSENKEENDSKDDSVSNVETVVKDVFEDKKESNDKQVELNVSDEAGDASDSKDVSNERNPDGDNVDGELKGGLDTDNMKTIAEDSVSSGGGEEKTEHASDDVSAYIESVMKSVADIEASVAEELQKPTTFNTEYQPKLTEVEDSLSPKERLEKLMRLIEEDREKEEQKVNVYQEEELDMDEFLFNLVGANTITQAMVKNYRNENNDNKN